MKVAKPVYRYDIWCGSKAFGGAREKSLSTDEMHKPYVRGKRSKRHLPDAWTNTKWIKRQKSWKHRCKKRKQWMKHLVSKVEKLTLGLITWEECYK